MHATSGKIEFTEFQAKSQPKGVHSRTKEVAFRGNGSKKNTNQERKTSANRQNKTFNVGKSSSTMLVDSIEKKEHNNSKSYLPKSQAKTPIRQQKINPKVENLSSNQSAILNKNQTNNYSQYCHEDDNEQHESKNRLNHDFITENSNESPD